MAVDDIRPVSSQSSMLEIKEERSPSESGLKKSTIHSGHFMVSRVHDVNNDEDEEEVASPFSDDGKGFDFLTANKETFKTYNFGTASNPAVPIDASLTKLFECMTLAYSGKITSPRWKQFRGLHVSPKQRIRLNNLIWREWHMQYIYQKMPMVCQFATPLSDDIHSKPEAVVLEGKYWKRRLDTVTAEYKKWRRYFKERIRQQQGITYQETKMLNEKELLERVKEVTFIPHSSGSVLSNTDLNLLQGDMMMDMDFTNDLFASLNQPFAFPNPRELSQLGCADLIQPGLVQLQPNLEEFMDIDSMQELLSAKQSSFSSSFMADTAPSIDMTQGHSDMSLADFFTSSPNVSGLTQVSNETSNTSVPTLISGNGNTVSFLTNNSGSPQNITFQLTSDSLVDPGTFLVGTPSGSQGLTSVTPQTFTIVPTGLYRNLQQQNPTASQQRQGVAITTSELLAQMLQQRPQEATVVPKGPSPELSHSPIHHASVPTHQHLRERRQDFVQQTPSPSSQSPLLAQSLSQQQQRPSSVPRPNQSPRKSTKVNKMNKQSGPSDAVSASGVMTGLANMARYNKKKDGPFTVPAKPVIAPRKNRVIAPAPPTPPPQQSHPVSPSPSSQASYLAELLKNGTYPGALINVKKEPQVNNQTAASSPIQTTTNLYQQISNIMPTPTQPMPAIVTVTAVNQIQGSLPLLTGASGSSVDVQTITNQGLGNVILSNSLGSSSPAFKESPTTFTNTPDNKVASPISLLPKSPESSPLTVKWSPCPSPSMDTGLTEPPSFSTMPMSPMSMPDSPNSNDSSVFPKENRRAAHLSAEQKRRCNLKTGFDMLQQLVPSLAQNPKVSKATMLQKTAEYCKKLKQERIQMQKEATILKQEIDALNSAISVVQSQLPETGVPVTRQRKDQMKEMFDEYVRSRTMDNWKFWIFSVIMSTLYESYCNTVSTSSMEELCRTSLTWLDQSCSLVTLRPNVLNALRKLSTTTSILTEPQKVKDQALQAVAKSSKVHWDHTGMKK